MRYWPWILGGLVVGVVLVVTATTTTLIWSIPPIYQRRAAQYADAFAAAEHANGLPDGLLSRVAYQESRYDAEAVSQVGAIGIMQFMPATADDFGIDPRNPYQSIAAAGKYLAQLYRKFGSWSQALAAYNWGQGNQSRDLYDGIVGNEWPQETRDYVAAITGDLGIA